MSAVCVVVSSLWAPAKEDTLWLCVFDLRDEAESARVALVFGLCLCLSVCLCCHPRWTSCRRLSLGFCLSFCLSLSLLCLCVLGLVSGAREETEGRLERVRVCLRFCLCLNRTCLCLVFPSLSLSLAPCALSLVLIVWMCCVRACLLCAIATESHGIRTL